MKQLQLAGLGVALLLTVGLTDSHSQDFGRASAPASPDLHGYF